MDATRGRSLSLLVFSGVLSLGAFTACTGASPAPMTLTQAPAPNTTATIPAPPRSTPPVYTFEPVDSGVEDGANGTVATGSDGHPYSYSVAAGDKLINIADRFGIDVTELTNVAGDRYRYSGFTIYPGDELRFKGIHDK